MAMREMVPAPLAGERVDRVVAMMTGASRAKVNEWLEDELIFCNEKVVTTRSVKVNEGDEIFINVDLDAPPEALTPAPDVDVDFLYVDDDIFVIDKAAGVVVHPGAGNEKNTLVQAVLARYPEIAEIGDPLRPGVVHRLDKDTSGLMLMARSPEAFDVLSDMMAEHEIERRYTTLVWGIPSATNGLIDAPIGRSIREPTKMVVSAQGKPARTRYRVIETFTEPAEAALVECELETGRTHQIRVHMAAIGHPVVGDERYRGKRAVVETPRMVLHSSELVLRHPCTDEELSFSSPLPEDLRAVVEKFNGE
ncbi:MAG: hypothetical protein RLZZ31_576 [Actinomycetota bacterium]|jgi:23S rRNA pseudouridine1911/1915/1917 synthase